MNKQICMVLFAFAAILADGNVAAQSSSSSSTSTATCGQAGGTCADNFQGLSASLSWTTLGTNNGSSSSNACLTAGNGTGSIQACPSTLAGYSIPASEQTKGQGALLLTPPELYQTGAILSAFPPFPLSQGINITFTTYTYGGNSYNADSGNSTNSAQNGADGITFILTDGTKSQPTTTGGNGGSMGYSCSNGNNVYNGMAYAYLGLGIDEYGNFLNNSDNTSTGIAKTSANSYGSGNYQPERIGLRGSGDTNWTALGGGDTVNFPNASTSFYSGSLTYYTATYSSRNGWTAGTTAYNKVQQACSSGTYVTSYSTVNIGGTNYVTSTTTSPITYNYNAISGGYAVLPGSLVCTKTKNGSCTTYSGYTSGSQPIANNSTSATRNPTSTTATANIAWPITYQLKITASGLLSFSYSYNGGAPQQVMTNTNITTSNGPLPTSLRFGFSAGTGGGTNVHEITCFKASPLSSTSSAAANTIQSGQYKSGTQIYLASYSASPWWGSLQAIALNVDPTTGDLVANNVATWDGKCTLTGGWCDTMGTDTNGNPVNQVTTADGFVAPENRVLVTATGNDVTTSGNGVGFSMQQSLSKFPSAVQTSFNASTINGDSTSTGQQRLDWLLGIRCFEQLYSSTQSSNGPAMYSGDCSNTSPIGNQNPRTYVLGDIIDSSPTWVGAPVAGQYNNAFSDSLWGTKVTAPENATSAQTYGNFVSTNATRLNVVYAGSNDGYLHGFEAGSFGSTGTYSNTDNDGKEVIGFMPYNVLLNQAAQLTGPLYSHQYLVDATPGAGDLFYNGVWHTWLVGGVGSNGKEIYVLDITNPGNFSQSNAGSLVIGDWTNATMPHLGNTVGTPSVVRMHNGQWAIIFGNGLNSGTTAGVYIGLVTSATSTSPVATGGAVTFLYLDTGVGSSSNPNGIAYVTPVDLDGDGIMDYLYAGDQQGNVWRFDVTSDNAANWSVTNFGSSTTSTCSNSSNLNSSGSVVTATCSPLFTATSSTTSGSTTTTVPQPITTGIVTATILTNGVYRDMLYFGTGEQSPQTGSSGVQYAPQSTGSSATTQQQSFYGIWDWNMSSWNGLAPNTQLASQTATTSQPISISASNLLAISSTETTVTGQGQITGYRTLSSAGAICWAGSGTCSTPQYGWIYNLPDTNEQIIYTPTIIDGAVVVNTAIPPVASNAQCTANSQTGWTMAFDATTGGAVPGGFFPVAGQTISGLQYNGVGTSTAVTYNGNLFLIGQTAGGGAAINRVTPGSSNSPTRVSWREIRN